MAVEHVVGEQYWTEKSGSKGGRERLGTAVRYDRRGEGAEKKDATEKAGESSVEMWSYKGGGRDP